MHIADEDPEVVACGYILSRTGLLPTDPRFRELVENPLLMMFTYHWLQKYEDAQLHALWRALGVYWTWEDVHDDGQHRGPQSELFVPLSIALNPQSGEFQKWLKQSLSAPVKTAPGKPRKSRHVELGDLPKEEFLEMTRAMFQAIGRPIKIGDPVEPPSGTPETGK
jgi:hypothetical protein